MELSERLSLPIKNTPFRNRPLAFVFAVFLGALFLFQVDVRLFIGYALVCAAFSVKQLFFSLSEKRGRSVTAYLVLAAVISAVLLTLPARNAAEKLGAIKGEHEVKAVITEMYYDKSFGSMYQARLVSIDGEKYDSSVTLTFPFGASLSEYDTVTVTADIYGADGSRFGYNSLSAKSNKVYIDCHVTEIKNKTYEAKETLEYRIYTLRRFIDDRFSSLLSEETAAYAKALVIGESSDIAASFRVDMSALGISHILAVSGMHMSIIATIITFIVEKLSYSRKIKSVVVIVGSISFMAIAGFSPSAVRACIMLVISMLSVFFHGRSDSLTSLFTAGAIICMIDPSMVISCSFLLSFFATLGIVLCSLYIQRRTAYMLRSSRAGDMRIPFKVLKWLAFSMLMSLCATFFTAPVMALYFSNISFFSIAMNLIAVPMAFVSMVLSILVLALGSVPYVGKWISFLLENLYSGFRSLVKILNDTFETSVSLKYWFFPLCVALLIAILAFIWLQGIRSPLAVIGAFLISATVFASSVMIHNAVVAGQVDLTYYTSESSDGFRIDSGSETYYVDVGNGSSGLPLQGLRDAFEVKYRTGLDGYVITHYHSKHASTVQYLIKRFGMKKLYLPEPVTENDKSVYRSILSVIKDEPEVSFKTYQRGQVLKLGYVKLQSAPYCELERSTHPVMIMRFSLDGRAITYIGSSVSESEQLFTAESYIAESGDVIVGVVGPVQKQTHVFHCFDPKTKIYLSPYEQLDEETAFPSGEYIKMKVDARVLSKRFILR